MNLGISELNGVSQLNTPNLSDDRERDESPESPSKLEVEDLTSLELGIHSTRRMRTKLAEMQPFIKVSPIV